MSGPVPALSRGAGPFFSPGFFSPKPSEARTLAEGVQVPDVLLGQTV